ncbi:STAS domain-containing protein [Dactylosporangium sucinum]|uniref:Anti-sigma factor antagonist n=1 Tax=Dactylosporangium sucinum TaxID=1424081 RepID=A0A917UCX5_9ACTN|nr:STAS domain-containing protein [Dactylosporangium sucinum]GGM78952.1 anti-sigma-B factor antagonist [Dactylosporangium sucinum]
MTDDIATEAVDGCLVVSPAGALDVATSPALHTLLHRSLDEGTTQLVLDLSAVDFIDSTALRVLVSVHKRLRESGGFAVVCPHARIRRIFDLTALDRVLTLTDTVDEALVALKSG